MCAGRRRRSPVYGGVEDKLYTSRRGKPAENAASGQNMPFMDGHKQVLGIQSYVKGFLTIDSFWGAAVTSCRNQFATLGGVITACSNI